jgi:hypothetical protein
VFRDVGVVVDPVRVSTGDGFSGNAQFGRDGRRGDRVVAGDHPDPDARVVALLDRLPRLRARRVDDADQREKPGGLRRGQAGARIHFQLARGVSGGDGVPERRRGFGEYDHASIVPTVLRS